jgi:hypothetical protein
VRMEIPPRFDVCDVCAIGVQTQKANGWALARSMTWLVWLLVWVVWLVWASTTTVSGFSGWSAGHSNRDGLRSGTKVLLPSGLSHLSCPRPWTMDDPPLHHSTTPPLHHASAPKSRRREKILYVRVSQASRQIESTSTPSIPAQSLVWYCISYGPIA